MIISSLPPNAAIEPVSFVLFFSSPLQDTLLLILAIISFFHFLVGRSHRA
ncbi:hypothetical protein HOY80DRAFT_896954 [Tuber brumale]|nr:hypothetical protein HOY80DRAFT_896954 [Tuber brumale]